MSETGNEIIRLGQSEVLRFPPVGSDWARSGWSAFFSDAIDRAQAQVLLRFGLSGNVDWDSIDPAEPSPLIVRETLVRGSGAGGVVTAALVREVPFARIEAAANRRLAGLAERPQRGDFPFVNNAELTRAPALLAQWAQRPAAGERGDAPPLVLYVPEGRKRPDEFYRQVANLFQWLTERGRKPAVELAEANGVPVTTVHRWVKEARRRGILPPARRGESPPKESEE